MLRMNWLSAAAAATYFDTHLETSDYYRDDLAGESGIWKGKGAERLGLSGEVKSEDFKKLAHNRIPGTNQKLTPRDVPGHPRSVIDMSFSVPKGISLAYLIGDQQDIRSAFEDAVHHTMVEIEKEAKSRVRGKGIEDHDINTSNLIWSEYLHTTSRPVQGTSDPQLHMHCVVHNATYRDDKGRFMALQAGDLKRDAPYFEAIYFERLAQNLKNLGYQVEPTSKGPDIVGIPKEIKDKFSRRTHQIEHAAERLGITDPKLKSFLGPQTRESKSSNPLTYAEQKLEWRQRLTTAELNRIQSAKWYSKLENPKRIQIDQALTYAMQHVFERQSVMSYRNLIAEAHKHAVGQGTIGDLEKLKPDGLIVKDVKGQKLCTLDSILKKELALLKLVEEGKCAVRPLNENYQAFRFDYLNKGQRGAVQHILKSKDRVTMVSGKAGVGKTTLMKEIQMAIQSQGKRIFAYAPTAQASRTILKKEGFKEANTVAFLLNQKDHSFLTNQVLLIDEVGLLGTSDAEKILRIAQEQNARVVFSGDRLQHQAVSGSPALNVLQNSGLVQPYHVDEIVRQKGTYKQAITDITNGQYEKAVKAFEKAGWIKEGEDKELYASIAKDYVETHHFKDPNLVVVPTHEESEVVTAFIRKSLWDRGQLGKHEASFESFRNRKLTTAEKSQTDTYTSGQWIEFKKSFNGFKRGERGEVISVHQTHVVIDVKGKTRTLNLNDTTGFDAYEKRVLGIRKGDLLQVTSNGLDLNGFRLNNGDRYKIKGFTKDGIRLEGGKILPKGYGHCAFGYTSTSFAAQGKSVPAVQVLMNDAVKGAINQAQFYVSVSRGKHKAHIYTNNISSLKRWIYKPSDKLTALDVVGYSKRVEEQLTRADVKRRVVYFIKHYQGRAREMTKAAAFKGTQLLKRVTDAPSRKIDPNSEPWKMYQRFERELKRNTANRSRHDSPFKGGKDYER